MKRIMVALLIGILSIGNVSAKEFLTDLQIKQIIDNFCNKYVAKQRARVKTRSDLDAMATADADCHDLQNTTMRSSIAEITAEVENKLPAAASDDEVRANILKDLNNDLNLLLNLQ